MGAEITMPKLAMAMNEGTVVEWLVAEGDQVDQGANLLVVETEKVTYDLESPGSGLLHIEVPPGETVAVETVIGRLAAGQEELVALQGGGVERPGPAPVADDDSAESPEQMPGPSTGGAQPTAAAKPGGRIKASPVVRKIAREHGLDLSSLVGTGPHGRIVKRDVINVLEQASADPVIETTQEIASAAGTPRNRIKARLPLRGIRKSIANRMMESQRTAAQLSAAYEVEFTRMADFHQRLLEREEELGIRVTIPAMVAVAISRAVRAAPIVNSTLVDDEIVIYDNVNLGIAVALPGETEWDSSLIVPVLRDVDRKGLVQVSREMRELVSNAREGRLKADDMSGGTITMSSLTGIAPPGLVSAPILNLPQAVVVSPSTPVRKAIVRNDELVAATVMPVGVTYDHRIIDGVPILDFLTKLKDLIENPEFLVL